MTSFPVYILDDDSILCSKADIGHSEYWESEVCLVVARKYKIDLSQIINMPYCQRRGRIVGNVLYCGELLSGKVLKNIEKVCGHYIKQVYDDHEIRCDISLRTFRGLLKS